MSITLVIIICTVLISFMAFNRFEMTQQLVFWPYEVKRGRQWHRFITSGFIHSGYLHLFFNMYVLYIFGVIVENAFTNTMLFGDFGRISFLIMYLLGIVVSELPSYFKHKDNVYYRSLGASGAVAAVLFSLILIDPLFPIGFLFVPGISFPAVILGIGYLWYSWYMDKKQVDNIGHSAHFYGALFGFAFTLALKPSLMLSFIGRIQSQLPF
ncbi:MAG: rhomboid family intramembrane serine protease [Chitinophagales bacterium]|nr:rhomboid family intramembrane serine protease [Chitinophagales bacterium]